MSEVTTMIRITPKNIQRQLIEEQYRRKVQDFYKFALSQRMPNYKIEQTLKRFENIKTEEIRKLNCII